jgi:hypothetical protein
MSAPFIIHLEQTNWVNVETQNPYVFGNLKYIATYVAETSTIITPPVQIAGKLCLMKCNTAILFYSAGGQPGITSLSNMEVFTNLSGPHNQFYDKEKGLVGSTPAVLNMMNNRPNSTGYHMVWVPEGPFKFVLRMRRADELPIARSGSQPYNPAFPDAPYTGVPASGRVTAILEIVPME